MLKVSVVIPLYNKEKYIFRTIQSVLGQSIPPAEIVVVDDGSTDSSANEVLQIHDNRIRLIRQQNMGEGAARNNGVEKAKHELVAFLDADDEWKPDFLLHIKRLLINFPDCGAYATAYETIEPGGTSYYPPLVGISPAPWIGILPNLFQTMQYDSPFCSSSIAITKRVFLDLQGFPLGVKQGADRILWIRLGMKYPIAFSPSRQAIYHRDAENRVCINFEPEPAASKMIDRMLLDQEIPLALLKDVTDYNATLIIQKARLSVKEGRPLLARKLLGTIKHNRKYRFLIYKWYFWSFIPYPIIKIIHDWRLKKNNSV